MHGDALARRVTELCHATADGHDTFPDVLSLMARIVGSDFASLSMISLTAPAEAVVLEHGRAALSAKERADWERLVPTHPYAGHVATAANPSLRLTDVVDMREFVRTEVYQVCLEPMGARYQAAMRVARSPEAFTLLSLWRSDRDFTDDELKPALTVAEAFRAALSLRALLGRISAGSAPLEGTDAPALTARQNEVIALIARGLTNDQIAGRLGISPRTVRKHVEDLFERTGARSRTELAVLWTSPARYGTAFTPPVS